MDRAVARCLVRFCGLTAATVFLGACATTPPLAATRNQIIISVRDQKLTVVKEDHTRVAFPISTSKFGLGDRRGTYETPTGEMMVASKIGGGAPVGSVFHGRVRTGEIVKVDAPGRDAIVTRILALRGLEQSNQQAFSRGIYIHGTPEERNIGRPTSYGCIRMRSKDVVAVYDMVKVGARVQIIDTTQNQAIAANIVKPTIINPASAPVPPNSPAAAAMQPTANAAPAPTSSPVPGQTSVVKSITTTGSGPNVKTTTTAVAANGSASSTRTTVVNKVASPAPAPVLASATSKKDPSSPPGKPLVKANTTGTRAPQRAAPTPTRPIANNSDDDGTVRHRSTPGSL